MKLDAGSFKEHDGDSLLRDVLLEAKVAVAWSATQPRIQALIDQETHDLIVSSTLTLPASITANT